MSMYTYQDAEENKSLETTVPGWGGTLTPACPWLWGAGESWLSSWAEPNFLVHVQLHSLKPVPSLTLRGKHKRSACMQKGTKTTRI